MANPLTGPEGDDGKAVLDEAIEIGCDVLGAVPYIEDFPEATVTHILHLAKETGLRSTSTWTKFSTHRLTV